MIFIVTSDPRERAAFADVCATRGWTHTGCDSVRACRQALGRLVPTVALTRHRLRDGYSDDVLAACSAHAEGAHIRVIVLAVAGTPSAQEARQLALGADCVLRDPVRIEVLLEYLDRHMRSRARSAAPRKSREKAMLRFAGALINPADRSLRHGNKSGSLTPRELQLVQLLAAARGTVVTYEELYQEVLGRPFQGDTSNMRVLLGKLDASFRAVGIPFRDQIEVIAKSGYRYRARRQKPRLLRPGAQENAAA